MIEFGAYQPLRFYEALDHQNRSKAWVSGDLFKLISPNRRLLPFQIKRAPSNLAIVSIKYVEVVSGVETELISSVDPTDLKTFTFADYDLIVHFGKIDSVTMPTGQYYIKVSDGSETWYSEVVTLQDFDPDDIQGDCSRTAIEYYDTCFVGDVFYGTEPYGSPQYSNIIYLDVELGASENLFNEEGDEDGEGEFVADYKKLEKQYFLQTVVPEFMKDALHFIPLHKHIEVRNHLGYGSQVETLAVNHEWQGEDKAWAIIDLLFITDTIVKTDCCDFDDQPLDICLRDTTDFVAEILQGSADYDNHEYTSHSDGTTKVPLVDGDLVLIGLTAGERALYTYNATSSDYDVVATVFVDGDAISDLNKQNAGTSFLYLRDATASDWIPNPTISFLGEDAVSGRYKVQGLTWSVAALQVWAISGGGTTLVATTTGQEYIAVGALFDIPLGASSIFVRAVGVSCTLGDSPNEDLGGVDYMEIGNTFVVS